MTADRSAKIFCYDRGVSDPISSPLRDALARIGAGCHELELLVLFGSRARADAREQSDWDFGYLGAAGLDADALLFDLVTAVGTDRVDLVDLARAGAQLRFRAAGESQVVFERRPGAFGRFWIEAVSFWCDIESLLKTGYADVLARLRR